MIAYLSLLYHSPEGGVMAYLDGVDVPITLCNTLLQHTQPAPSYSAAFVTLYVSCEYPLYVHMCLCYSATCDYIQTFCIPHLLLDTHTVLTCIQTEKRTCKAILTPTKKQKQLLNTPRQVGNQHVFITGLKLVILPKVYTNMYIFGHVMYSNSALD